MTALVRYDAMRLAIQSAHKIDEAKDIRDKAQALAAYARQRKDPEMSRWLAEIKLRAKRRIGELSLELDKDPQSKGGNSRLPSAGKPLKSKASALKEAGLSTSEANRCEKIASVPTSDFEAYIAEKTKSGKEVDANDVERMVAKKSSHAKRAKDLKTKHLPDGKFQVIYADPPWQYSNSGFAASAENRYPTMSIEQINDLAVGGLADKDCVLFMWATNPLLSDAIELISKWGFEYKTNFVWVKKKHMGLGFYVMGQHELLLIATKGAMLPTGEKPPSVITGDNSVHSKKPESVYWIIESMYPGLKYCELFARNKREGWESWGNQCDS